MRMADSIPASIFLTVLIWPSISGANSDVKDDANDFQREDTCDHRVDPKGLHRELLELEANLSTSDSKRSSANSYKKYAVKGAFLHDLTVTLADVGIEQWQYPIDPLKFAGSQYGPRTRNFSTGRRHFHHGQDVACTQGENIYAAADGTVVVSTYSRTAGYYITIDHSLGKQPRIETRYMHLSKRYAKMGHHVKAGDIIGRCGSTGQSTGAHLHFEVIEDTESIHPFRFETANDQLQCPNFVGTSTVVPPHTNTGKGGGKSPSLRFDHSRL